MGVKTPSPTSCISPGDPINFNAPAHLNAVQRSVSSPERNGQPARAVAISRAYPTTVEDLWDAITNAERIPRWFLPVEGDLEPGGRYQLKDNAGGEITACEPLSHFVLTWEFGDDVSWLDVHLSNDDDESDEAGRAGDSPVRITLTHTASLSDHWEQYGPSAAGIGWDMSLLGLYLHLSQPDEPMPAPEVFTTSPDGKAFLTGSGEAWGQAAIAAGTDPAAARAAARNSIAFYTGTA